MDRMGGWVGIISSQHMLHSLTHIKIMQVCVMISVLVYLTNTGKNFLTYYR